MGELDHILQRLEASLGPLSGEPAPLAGGITNRNYRVTLGGSDYVVRLPGKDTNLLGIDREAERAANATAAALGLAPAVTAASEEYIVTEFVACHPVSGQEVTDGVVEIAAALRAFHDSGLRLSTRFWVPQLLADYAEIVQQRGGSLPDAYAVAVRSAEQIEAALPLSEPRPCHNDLLPGNIICGERDGRMMLVDWEYAGMGDPRFDLGNLSINNSLDDGAQDRLLTAYYGAAPTDAQRAALRMMCVLSDAREAAWGVVQAHVSELDFDFHGYAAEHFERLRTAVVGCDFEDLLVNTKQSNREDPSSAQTA